jgi:hypothetical protein
MDDLDEQSEEQRDRSTNEENCQREHEHDHYQPGCILEQSGQPAEIVLSRRKWSMRLSRQVGHAR